MSVFLPLEHARLAHAAEGNARTALFARYSLTGSLCGAVGALAAGVPAWLDAIADISLLNGLRAMFLLYAVLGGVIWLLYRRLPRAKGTAAPITMPLGPSRPVVFKLAALFSVDAFAGGLVVNSLLTLWLFERFGLSLGRSRPVLLLVGTAVGVLPTCGADRRPEDRTPQHDGVHAHPRQRVPDPGGVGAEPAAGPRPPVRARARCRRWTFPRAPRSSWRSSHPPSARPRRASPPCREASPRRRVPTLAGALLAAGLLSMPLVACGALKIAYDLALLVSCRRIRLPADSR